MSEPNKGDPGNQPDSAAVAKQTPPLGWRRNPMGLGMFAFVVALFAAASGKDLGSLLAKGLLAVAFLLIAVPLVTIVVNFVLSKIRHTGGATAKPES